MSLIELLIAMFVLVIVLTIGSAAYFSGQKAWQHGNELNEITQNSRIAIDKISRELRQTEEIVTAELPALAIEFQDGHSEEPQYLYYYLDGSLLKRQIILYELDNVPVRWNIPGATRILQQEQIIADNIAKIQFSGDKRLMQIEVNDFSTKVVGRNIK